MPKIVRFHETGPADVLKVEDLPLQEPRANEVRIKVEAIGLNRAEVMFRRGMYLEQPRLPARLGYEAAGVVDAIGPGVIEIKVGDRVSVVPSFSLNEYGTYGERVVVPAAAAVRYPQHLSPTEATSIWMQYLTAWGALIHYGNIKAGDFVLISAASSSVGLAAIELTRLAGAKPIATTRGSSKKQALLDAGAYAVIATQEEDLSRRVAEITDGKGANLIFDPVGGKFLESLAQAAAPRAQIIEYGALAPEPTPYPLFTALSKGLVIRAYVLYEFVFEPAIRKRAEEYVFRQLEKRNLHPRIDRTFPLAQIVEAHRYMESNQQNGKIVVTV
ncbi:MAG TPA: zinc-dependent alcohol dehydrogenase family protein [Terriglobales bacterium]|nr:zinc-dependent alcohol dehydrogenase family protein [Terriglobales bacterium]